jgi:hypothetical protein
VDVGWSVVNVVCTEVAPGMTGFDVVRVVGAMYIVVDVEVAGSTTTGSRVDVDWTVTTGGV